MSDRGLFVTAFLTAVLVVAGAFALPQFFFFELFKSLIYILVAVMVFFGEDRYSYMLAILAPVLWFILDIALGGFFSDGVVLLNYLRGMGAPPLDTPLHGLAILFQILLVVLAARAWRKQVTGPFIGRTFGVSLAVSVVYVGVLFGWYFVIPTGGRIP